MTAYDFMKLWRKMVADETGTNIFIELPDGTQYEVADISCDPDDEDPELVIYAG